MKTNRIRIAVVSGLVLFGSQQGHSQGTFQNLDFESANLPVVPSGQYGGLVSSTDAVPNWIPSYGTDQQSQILHNNLTLGAVNVSIFGPIWNPSSPLTILQGNYSVLLQSGLGGTFTRTLAAIAQTGMIPASALSLQFFVKKAEGDISQLDVSIGGQSVSIYQMSTASGYAVYGADISQYAGQTKELKFSSLSSPASQYNYFMLDSISFSNQPIPEPSTVALFSLGALLLGWRRFSKRGE